MAGDELAVARGDEVGLDVVGALPRAQLVRGERVLGPVARRAAVVEAAALQYVRKISGYTKPSQANQEAFDRAVAEVAAASARLLDALETNAPAKNREVEAEKRRARAANRTYARA